MNAAPPDPFSAFLAPFANDGDAPLPLQAVFPTTRVWIRTLERNPAPGTEDDAPQAGATYDFRTGDVEFDPA